MFVACSTLCFARETLEAALRQIAEMEFDKYELAIVEDSQHLRPSEVGADPEAALQRLRRGPSLIPSSIYIDFGPEVGFPEQPPASFDGLCRLAKSLSVAVLTIHAAPFGSSMSAEIKRLQTLQTLASREGLVLSVLTHSASLTADPAAALELCRLVPGLGLTLDPSHYIQGPHRGADYEPLLPYVQNVHFRDTGKEPGAFQVRVGQGEVEYNKIITLLERRGYSRSLTIAIIDRPDNPFDREVEVRKLRLLLESFL